MQVESAPSFPSLLDGDGRSGWVLPGPEAGKGMTSYWAAVDLYLKRLTKQFDDSAFREEDREPMAEETDDEAEVEDECSDDESDVAELSEVYYFGDADDEALDEDEATDPDYLPSEDAQEDAAAGDAEL